MGYDVFKFGALYLDDKIQFIPQQTTWQGNTPRYDGYAVISIRPTEKEECITWIKPNGSNLLIADRVLLTNVTWEDFNKNGFVAGKTVLLDGQCFRCRLLRVGEMEGVPTEWDKILDATSEDDILWHWKNIYFLGVDISGCGTSTRVVRGWGSARRWHFIDASNRYVNVGFRPALEPLPSGNPTPNINLDGVDFQLTSLPGSNAICPILQPMLENVFKDIPTESRIRMYTFVENGRPIHFGTEVEDVSKLTLTDCYFGDEYLVPWVISNGVAVADRFSRSAR